MDPTLLVHLNPSGGYDWKRKGVKGAKWNSNVASVDKACDEAVKRGAIETPFFIQYCDDKDRAKL